MEGYSQDDVFVGRMWADLRWLALMWVPAGDDRIVAVVDRQRYDIAYRDQPPLAVLLPRSWLTKDGARFASTLLGAEFDTNSLRKPTVEEETAFFGAEVLRSYTHVVTSDEAREREVDDEAAEPLGHPESQ